ncbi:VRR-NUC domain-containing protein [Bacteroides finegoldii]|uniref:VRR-NUC domain-containing protein n=1 Tax=Bacteroides finegoldii TaxID=338188 RepID=UPI00234E1F97|nr:VRR-NUC domain-containing protein [Bacteroides finegoldii]MDC7140113.1 VRR-NUC domain-containing protein [Bacteroides finegoldii]
MTYEEMIKLASKAKSRKKPTNDEHKMQCACVKWFRLEYPKLKDMLFAVPNAARRSARNGEYMKDEGMLPGVADLILLKSNRFYGALCVEMKKPGKYQRPVQKEWQKECEAAGNKYVVCRSLDEFMKVITDYLNDI